VEKGDRFPDGLLHGLVEILVEPDGDPVAGVSTKGVASVGPARDPVAAVLDQLPPASDGGTELVDWSVSSASPIVPRNGLWGNSARRRRWTGRTITSVPRRRRSGVRMETLR
jgi:hypothetical protein